MFLRSLNNAGLYVVEHNLCSGARLFLANVCSPAPFFPLFSILSLSHLGEETKRGKIPKGMCITGKYRKIEERTLSLVSLST